jgi:hypothetical protein
MTEDLEKVTKEQRELLEENARYIEQMEAVIHNLRDIVDTQTEILSGDSLFDECPECKDHQRFIKNGFCLTCNKCVLNDIRTSMPDNVDDQIEEKKLDQEPFELDHQKE